MFGGVEGVVWLVVFIGWLVLLLNFVYGVEVMCGVVVIDEVWCIGCMFCIKVCLVDCIVGVLKVMYVVVVV